jgi:hypothetical protein
MKRSELEHLIRASGAIADDTDIVVIGSQSILGQFPDAPAKLLASAEADLFPYVAGREKDLEFTRELAKQGMTDSRVLIARVDQTELPAEIRELVRARVRRDFTGTKPRT